MTSLLQILLLALHLICMNVASGAPLVCIWLEWRARAAASGKDAARSSFTTCLATNYLAATAVMGMLVGTLLGILLGWWLWTVEYSHLWTGRLAHKATWGILEMLFSLVLLAGYWLWRQRGPTTGLASFVTKSLLLALASTNLLYHFPTLFLIAGRLTAADKVDGPPVIGALFRQEMISQEVPSLSVHFALASVAMAGIMLLGLTLRMARRGACDEDVAQVAVWGGRWALLPSLLQLPVGLWVLATLSPTAQSRLMGSDALGTALFLAGVGSALWLVRELVAIAMGETERVKLIRAMTAMIVVTLLMTGAHQQSKTKTNSKSPSPSPAALREGESHAR